MSLVNISCIFSIVFRAPGSSSLSLFWILFLKGCLSLLHLVVFLGFYLVPSSGTKPSAFSSWLTFCDVVLVLATVGLWFFFLLLSAFWRRRLKDLCNLPDGRGWQWKKLGLNLMVRMLLSKVLIQLSAGGWGHGPSLVVVCSEATHPWGLWVLW